MEEARRPSDIVFESGAIEKGKFYSKVFLYLGLGILLTAIVSLIVSYIFTNVAPVIIEDTEGQLVYNDSVFGVFLGVIIGATVLLIITNLIITFATLKGKGNLYIPYIIYALTMGVLIGAVICFTNFLYVNGSQLIGTALGATTLVFLVMAGLGFMTSHKIKMWGRVLLAVAITILLLVLVNFVIFPFAFWGGYTEAFYAYAWMYFGIEVLIILFFSLAIAFDMARIRTIADNGGASNNIALYCAVNLYSDIISLFLRILVFLLRIFGQKK